MLNPYAYTPSPPDEPSNNIGGTCNETINPHTRTFSQQASAHMLKELLTIDKPRYLQINIVVSSPHLFLMNPPHLFYVVILFLLNIRFISQIVFQIGLFHIEHLTMLFKLRFCLFHVMFQTNKNPWVSRKWILDPIPWNSLFLCCRGGRHHMKGFLEPSGNAFILVSILLRLLDFLILLLILLPVWTTSQRIILISFQ